MNPESKTRFSWAHTFMGTSIGGLTVHAYFYLTDSPKFNDAKFTVLLVMLTVSSWFIWRRKQRAKLGEPYSKTF